MLCPVRATDPATQICAQPRCPIPWPFNLGPVPLDLGFLMHRMATAARAKLFNGEFLSLALFVLTRSVIAPLAAIAC